MPETILIIDFGSQLTQLIARRVRELGVFSQIVPYHRAQEQIDRSNCKGIILSGGPASVYEKDAPYLDAHVWERGVPVLGICYGMQVMCRAFGGEVRGSKKREYGHMDLTILKNEGFFKGFKKGQRTVVWMSHGDRVEKVPPGFEIIAKSQNAPAAAIANFDRGYFGVQFHPEVHHTPEGKKMIENFLYEACGLKATWNPTNFIEQSIESIKSQIGSSARVISALSGGVDSSVASLLVHRAIGDRITCIFVDNGAMRKDEAKWVMQVFKENLKMNVIMVEAREKFLTALKGVTDPEQKRRIIGRTFIEVFEHEAEKIGRVDYLVQGTLYPDVIESVPARGEPSAKIKSHHNVGGLPEKMQLKLIEPLRELFKDEVREVGKKLGLPDRIVKRHPFPGPGLAVRIIGEVNEHNLRLLQEADAIIEEEIRKGGLYDSLWQVFGVLLPTVKTVGVMGDERSYQHPLAIRAVTSKDGMTADWARIPHEVLARISTRLVNEVKGINRVVYDISTKPPATIEWE